MILDERLSVFIDSMQWQIPEHIKSLEREALEQEVPIIRRSMQSLLGFVLSCRRPDRILEIGTAVGFSSILMSEYAPQAAITTIEKVPARIVDAKRHFAEYHKDGQITLLEGDALEVLAGLVRQEQQYDLIFMDAAKGQYLNFLPDLLCLLAPDGILVTDNVLQDGDVIQSRFAVTRRDRTIHGRMREYLYTLTHHEQLQTVILPVGDGAALSIRTDKEEGRKLC